MKLARETGARLHVLHLSTARELSLLEAGPLSGKKITGEACVAHLLFSQADYRTPGTLIKCNPAVKTRADRDALRRYLPRDKKASGARITVVVVERPGEGRLEEIPLESLWEDAL